MTSFVLLPSANKASPWQVKTKTVPGENKSGPSSSDTSESRLDAMESSSGVILSQKTGTVVISTVVIGDSVVRFSVTAEVYFA